MRYVLVSGGHIAGIVSPPEPKAWVVSSDEYPPTAEEWRERRPARANPGGRTGRAGWPTARVRSANPRALATDATRSSRTGPASMYSARKPQPGAASLRGLGQPLDRVCRQARGILAEPTPRRRAEVASRAPVHVQDRQHLGHLRRPTRTRRQDLRRETFPLAGLLVDARVVSGGGRRVSAAGREEAGRVQGADHCHFGSDE